MPAILPVLLWSDHQPSASDRTPVLFPFAELNPRPHPLSFRRGAACRQSPGRDSEPAPGSGGPARSGPAAPSQRTWHLSVLRLPPRSATAGTSSARGAWSYPVSHGNRRPLRIPDSADIDFRALERASLPKSLTRKLQEAAQLWSHSSVRGIEDVHCGIRHWVLRQQTHQCPIAQCIANQLYRL